MTIPQHARKVNWSGYVSLRASRCPWYKVPAPSADYAFFFWCHVCSGNFPLVDLYSARLSIPCSNASPPSHTPVNHRGRTSLLVGSCGAHCSSLSTGVSLIGYKAPTVQAGRERAASFLRLLAQSLSPNGHTLR